MQAAAGVVVLELLGLIRLGLPEGLAGEVTAVTGLGLLAQ